jgi:hypothetical protein
MNGRVRAAWRQFLLNALLISLGLILKYLVSSYWSWLLYVLLVYNSWQEQCTRPLHNLVLSKISSAYFITPSLQLRAFFCFAVALVPGLQRRAGNGAVAQLLIFGHAS